jgi:hypothetical protein
MLYKQHWSLSPPPQLPLAQQAGPEHEFSLQHYAEISPSFFSLYQEPLKLTQIQRLSMARAFNNWDSRSLVAMRDTEALAMVAKKMAKMVETRILEGVRFALYAEMGLELRNQRAWWYISIPCERQRLYTPSPSIQSYHLSKRQASSFTP